MTDDEFGALPAEAYVTRPPPAYSIVEAGVDFDAVASELKRRLRRPFPRK